MSVMKIAITLLAIVIVAGGAGFLEFQRNSEPTVRQNIQNPIYTIGELRGYSPALAAGKRVVKFGPMFFGLYAGGIAFRTPGDARAYLEDNGWDRELWSVYRLSGDHSLDVTDGFTNKSLLVVQEAP